MEEADPGSCLPELVPDEPPRPCGWPASVLGLDGEQRLLHEQRPANLGERDVTRQRGWRGDHEIEEREVTRQHRDVPVHFSSYRIVKMPHVQVVCAKYACTNFNMLVAVG